MRWGPAIARGALGWLVWALLGGIPHAFGGAAAVITDGPLRPGRVATLEIAATTPEGAPVSAAPSVAVDGGTLSEPTPGPAGIWRYELTPTAAPDGGQPFLVSVRVGGARAATFPVATAPPSSLAVERAEAVARGPAITIPVTSDGPLPVDVLDVVTGEGQVVSVVTTPTGAAVTLALDDIAVPRWVPVAIRDVRRDEQPAWVAVRVRARPRIPLVVEPGVQATLKIGSRTYGPFVADARGALDLRVDQYPGETTASLALVDDLGNETRSEMPLVAQTQPSLLAVASGEQLPGRTPPSLYVYAIGADGDPVAGPPTCGTPGGPLALASAGEGTYVAAVPPARDAADLRVSCWAGTASTTARVGVASGVATALAMRVWPDQLLADFAIAEVSVVMDDARGERMSVDRVVVDADVGTVHVDARDGIVLHAQYDGSNAVELGEDVVIARWSAPAGSGAVAEVQVSAGAVPTGQGPLMVRGRALDALRRPLAGVELALSAGDAVAVAVTGQDGWARAPLDVDLRGSPLRIGARSSWREAARLVLPGQPALRGPGDPDLEVRHPVGVRAGRVRGISIEVDPSVLRAAPGAVAWVTVKLEDGAGQPVTDEPIDLVASEGEVGELRARPDGTLVAEYVPNAADHTREVEITARTATVRSSTHLTLEPRVVQLSFGPWVGAHTNFGALTGIAGGVDLDVRLRAKLIGETLVLRTAAAGIGLRSSADTGVGPPVDLRSTIVPVSAMLVFRQDRGRFAVWAGGGGTLAPRYTQVRFGDSIVSKGTSLLGGPSLAAGAGLRAPGGEVVLTVQASWLPAPDDDVGYSGNLGGLMGGLGYRLVY